MEPCSDVYFTWNHRVVFSLAPLNVRFPPSNHADHISLKCSVLNVPRQCKIYAAPSDSIRVLSLSLSLSLSALSTSAITGWPRRMSQWKSLVLVRLALGTTAQWSALWRKWTGKTGHISRVNGTVLLFLKIPIRSIYYTRRATRRLFWY